ncbi:hypothetical protein N9F50_01095 [Akkermansiaceae bacterium]|nr:hypothetical protein [Akkermansiaceae bacterium]MDB4419043.1 hypothetical protein [bacterium]
MLDYPLSSARTDALKDLELFIPRSGRYSRDRNHVLLGHENVSCLSPAIRHRLISEWEVAAAPLERYAVSTVEKFTQEIYWRSYWKSWLSLRPQVWDEYVNSIPEPCDFSQKIMSGNGPIAIMNYFANELRETGYLHNHARMWFSGYWIHIARLPWQLGARFFEQNLLDFDPASNTLSWRWVAGLQTPGKTYLPRRSNLEKYLEPELLAKVGTKGLDLLEKPQALRPEDVKRPSITRPELESDPIPDCGGLWIHEEDLTPELTQLSGFKSKQIFISQHSTRLEHIKASRQRVSWLQSALADAAARGEQHYKSPCVIAEIEDLISWAKNHQLDDIVTLRPEIGPLHDLLPKIKEALSKEGITLHLVIRGEDQILRPLAKAGFFKFWETLKPQLVQGGLSRAE